MGHIYTIVSYPQSPQVITNGHHIREYMLSGAYRYILGRAGNMEWKILRYNDPQCDLAITDVDRINEVSESKHDDGILKALQIAFTLPSSTYATMMLREVMKTSTSASFHRSKEVANTAEKAAHDDPEETLQQENEEEQPQ